VLVHLYEEFGDDFVNWLDGKFSFVISQATEGNMRCLVARDPIGVTSLYMGYGHDGSVWFASEMKALIGDCKTVKEFPPGYYWSSEHRELKRYYNAKWVSEEVPTNPLNLKLLSKTLQDAVQKRLMSDVSNFLRYRKLITL
jgi:asparagine synthase (glutamine-hydrolysing)